jgi:hypothetical protein
VARSTIAISPRALKARINRALAHERKQLRTDRRGGVLRHMLVDMNKGEVLETDIDLDKLVRKLEVLQPWERAAPPR